MWQLAQAVPPASEPMPTATTLARTPALVLVLVLMPVPVPVPALMAGARAVPISPLSSLTHDATFEHDCSGGSGCRYS